MDIRDRIKSFPDILSPVIQSGKPNEEILMKRLKDKGRTYTLECEQELKNQWNNTLPTE